MSPSRTSSVITIPDYVEAFPFTTRVNSHYAEVSSATEKWFSSWGVLEKPHIAKAYRQGDWTLLASLSVPDASASLLRLISDYLCWLFLFDDLCDEGDYRADIKSTRDVAKLTLAVLRNPDSPPTTFLPVEILRDFWNRASSDMPPRVRARFVQTIESYLEALEAEVTCRIANDFISVEAFIVMRRETSAVRTVLALMEFACGLDLPNDVIAHPSMALLVQLANDLISWTNDIYSFNGEQFKGQASNLVLIAMRQHNLTVHGGVDFVDELVRQAMERYVQQRHAIPSWGRDTDEDIHTFITGLDRWVVGAFKWSLGCERYLGPDFRELAQTLQIELWQRPDGPVIY